MAYLDEAGLRRVAEKILKKPKAPGIAGQVLRQNENGEPYWSDAANYDEVSAATTAWLQENISEISTTIPLDKDLKTEGAAADAKAAGAMIKVSNTQPTERSNRMWINSGEVEEIAVPTIAEHNLKADKSDTVLDTTLSHGRKTNTTVGEGSIAYGINVEASGASSAAFGSLTVASGECAIAQGDQSIASGISSHAEGREAAASDYFSHAEGEKTNASGYASHAEGFGSAASGRFSHAEGAGNLYLDPATGSLVARGPFASGHASHAEGVETIATCYAQHAAGAFNLPDTSTEDDHGRGTFIEIIGNGSDDSNRSNARTLDWNGNEVLAGDLTVKSGTADEISISQIISDINTLKSNFQQTLTLIAEVKEAINNGHDDTAISLLDTFLIDNGYLA